MVMTVLLGLHGQLFMVIALIAALLGAVAAAAARMPADSPTRP